jgi:gliding motility-associated-like protein
MDGIPNRLDTDQCEVFIPEGFTPNGDGMNDLFVISMLPVDAKIELEVYNRWGGLVYVSSDYANDWDGTNLDGNDLPVGTYFYVVKLTNEKLSYTNSLTLWR